MLIWLLDQPKNLQGKNGKVFLPYNFFFKKFWGYVLSYKINLLPSYFQEMQIQYQTSNIKANSLKWKAFPNINYISINSINFKWLHIIYLFFQV